MLVEMWKGGGEVERALGLGEVMGRSTGSGAGRGEHGGKGCGWKMDYQGNGAGGEWLWERAGHLSTMMQCPRLSYPQNLSIIHSISKVIHR